MSEGRRSRVRSALLPFKTENPPVPPPRQKSQRKCKKAVYLMFMGQAEGGKSTTLNMLFGGREITPVERETGTQEVLEFCASVSSGEIHVIDTPGLGDLNGLEWDAKVLASIESFRKGHQDLQICIPNVVVIVARFDDNRIAGDLSSFVKMLKSINYQRSIFIDSKFNNLIIILTHFMNGSKALRTDPHPRIELVKSLVKTYTNFVHEPLVLLAENEADDWELVTADKQVDEVRQEVANSPSGVSYLLPNGDSYPQNLIDAVLNICKESSDAGHTIFKEAFDRRSDLDFQQTPQSIGVVDSSNEIAQKTMAKLTNIYFTTRSSELFSHLNDKWIAMGRSTTEKCYEDLLVNLEKLKYRDFDQLPKDQELINEFLVSLKSNYDEGIFKLLEKLLNWQPSHLLEIMKKNVGFGFNIGNDEITEVSPFEFYNYATTPMIYKLPKEIKYEPITSEAEKEKLIFHVFRRREEYCEARMKDFHLQHGQKVVIEGKVKAGYNIVQNEQLTPQNPRKPTPRKKSFSLESSSTKSKDESKASINEPTAPQATKFITIAKEYRIGQLILQHRSSTPLDPYFVSSVLKLSTFNPNVRASMNTWRSFLHKFGPYIIQKAFLGGVIEITVDKEKLLDRIKKLRGKELNPANITTYENDLKQELTMLFDFGANNRFEDNLIIRLETKGGNKLLSHSTNFLNLGGNEKLQLFNTWVESLHHTPTLIDRNIQLIPIKTLVEAILRHSNETKQFLNSYDLAIKTLCYNIPKKGGSSKVCQFM